MKIAFLTTEYAHAKTPVYGGIGTFFKILADELIAKGNTVSIFVYGGKYNFDFEDGEIKIRVRKDFFRDNKIQNLVRSLSRRSPKFYSFYLKCFLNERKYVAKHFNNFIKDKNIDVIEVPDYGGYFYALDNKIPVNVRCHGTNTVLTKEFNYSFREPKDRALNDSELLSFKNLNLNIITVSKYAGSLIEKYFKRSDYNVIYNGVNINKFTSTSKDIIKDSIFYFGTLSEEKGVGVLCENFNKVCENNGTATLHIIGRREEYWQYLKENILTEKALERTTYYGIVDYNDLEKVLSKADMFVFPSRGENFPFVFLEAMSLQRPIIVNNIKPSYEIIEHGINGLITKSDEDFYNLIMSVLENKVDVTKLANNARNTVKENFIYNKMVDDTISFYKKTII
ncbi:glycosyltransferase family 4 protein [Tenacibaculum salmonis]|uniref:glycosyltransferase family 4 protein n=1 Tax=Tenacibaculum sp. P3-BQ1 TaxID=3232310 RepID=UPI0034DF5D68